MKSTSANTGVKQILTSILKSKSVQAVTLTVWSDIKKFIYAGCLQVIVNGSKPESMALAAEASKRFGKDRILVSVTNVDFIFKHQDEMADTFHEVLILNKAVLDAVEGMTDVPHVVNKRCRL